jgi:hypothetical protein
MVVCAKHTELARQVEAVLEKLVEITRAQREASLEKNLAKFIQLDKEMELTVGEKERIVNALLAPEGARLSNVAINRRFQWP